MGSKSARDVQMELSELEIEEARIMRELREMDEKANVARLRVDAKGNPRAVLNALLAECEREVREAKGFIKSTGPPLLIARCKRGEPVPPHATYLSRPKGTGVDFTVPVTLKEYNDAVKHPIFLDGIRDKCKANLYSTPEEYVADMRLLARNTATFNKGPELYWVVQHANLLLQTAEESVQQRRRELNEAQAGIPKSGSSRQIVGKRKRATSGSYDANGSNSALSAIAALTVGTQIQIFWDSDRKWYLATVREKGEGAQVLVEYQHEGSEWLDLHHEVKWRMPPSSSSGRSKRIADNGSKRKKGSSSSAAIPPPAHTRGSHHHRHASGPPAPGVTPEALHAVRDEIFTALDETKAQVLGGINDRFLRVETALNRSDALHRVLLAVHDVQTSMTASVAALTKNVETLHSTVATLAERVNRESDSAAAPAAAVPAQPDADPGQTEKEPEISAKKSVPDDRKQSEMEKEKAPDALETDAASKEVTVEKGVEKEVEKDGEPVKQTESGENDEVVIPEEERQKNTDEVADKQTVAEAGLKGNTDLVEPNTEKDDTVVPEKNEGPNDEQKITKEVEKKPENNSSGQVVGKEPSDSDEVVEVPVEKSRDSVTVRKESSPKKRSKPKDADDDSSSSDGSSDGDSSSDEDDDAGVPTNDAKDMSRKPFDGNLGPAVKNALPAIGVKRSESAMSLDSHDEKQSSPRKVQVPMKVAGNGADVMDLTQDSVTAPSTTTATD